MRLRQVEDDKSYWAVRDGIMKLVGNGRGSCDFVSAKSELDYLQEKRTAAMLQRIPGIVDDEFQRGNIQARRAIFTIGLSHLSKIIQYVNEHKIRIYPPLGSPDKSDGYVAELNLQKERFGISIIIPKTLADDQKILTMNGLDNIVAQSRSPFSVVRSTPSP